MVSGIVSHLPARTIFVIGKGGVGKSTTSSALALALADRGERTHLLSTDPAHSLGDLFGTADVATEEWTSPCTPLLTLEELDATRRARTWLEEVQEGVAELVERGTYLDRADVAALLDGSLPGMDEVMAALRIASLAASGEHERVVVDTAPTGHTLRLLDAGKVLGGWVAAVEAMAAKASAVALGLTGRRVRFSGQLTMERARADVDRFVGLLGRSDFVVVTRAGEAVEAETARLLARLRGRGLRVAAAVHVEEGEAYAEGSAPESRKAGVTPTFRVPFRDDLVGCEGLRRWGAGSPPRAPREPHARVSSPADPVEPRDALALLPPRGLMLFSGKGGVGKSTCAAAYAVRLSRERGVLLLSTDPAGSLGEVFGQPVGPEATPIGPRLVVRQLDAEGDFARFRDAHRHRIGDAFTRLGLEHSVALDRRVVESLVDMAPPGLDEIFAVDAVLDGTAAGGVMLLDTAPTGHFLRLLEMPEIALSWARALLRILLKYRSVLGLDDFAQEVLRFAKRLRSLIALLGDAEKSGVVVVTLGAALARRETERLSATLRQRGVPMTAVIQNRWAHGDAIVEGFETILSPFVTPAPVGVESLLALAARWRAA